MTVVEEEEAEEKEEKEECVCVCVCASWTLGEANQKRGTRVESEVRL